PGDLRDQPDAVARTARHAHDVAPGALEEPRSGHVDVRPGALADELVQELRGERGGGLAERRADLHVGERGVDVATVAGMEGERPDEVAAAATGLDDEVAPGVVVREQS